MEYEVQAVIEDNAGYPFTRSAISRRNFLARYIADCRGLAILEIGAFDNPTFARPEWDVRYLDWFSREELVEKHKSNPKRRVAHAVPVDYVVKDARFSTVVARQFDLVVAHHVIEHVPDVLSWLDCLAELTRPSGHLFLSIPDRRYTFDIDRECSDVVELLRCHDERITRPTYYQILRSIYYHQPVTADQAWSGTVGPGSRAPRKGLCEAMAEAASLCQEYHDVHCHVFTRDSFERVWAALQEAQLTPWRMVALGQVARDGNEFQVVLSRAPSG